MSIEICAHCGLSIKGQLQQAGGRMFCAACFANREVFLTSCAPLSLALTILGAWREYAQLADVDVRQEDQGERGLVTSLHVNSTGRELGRWTTFIGEHDVSLRDVADWLDAIVLTEAARKDLYEDKRQRHIDSQRRRDKAAEKRVNRAAKLESGPGIATLFRAAQEVYFVKPSYCRRCGSDQGCMCPRK